MRAQPERLKIVFDTLHWLGINWNEGPDIGGEYEPYIQSERKSSYLKATEHLIKKNRAYRCFCNQSANSHGCLRDCKNTHKMKSIIGCQRGNSIALGIALIMK